MVIVTFVTILTTSCNDDFLETAPTDAVTPKIALSSVADMQKVLDGIHRTQYSQSQTVFPGGTKYRANNHHWVPLGDNLAGELIHTTSTKDVQWRVAMQWNEHTVATSITNKILWYHRYYTAC